MVVSAAAATAAAAAAAVAAAAAAVMVNMALLLLYLCVRSRWVLQLHHHSGHFIYATLFLVIFTSVNLTHTT